MYASCASAHFRPSSRVIAWFCPSGSSVTMKVERFDRETTSVWTFRLPYLVGFAFGISAASALTSSGLGFSITLAAFGRRNSIFATRANSFSGWRDGNVIGTPARCPRRPDRHALTLRGGPGQRALAGEQPRELGARADVELAIDAAEVGLDRLRAQEER